MGVIVTFAAIEHVSARVAVQLVVASAAGQRIVTLSCVEEVVPIVAGEAVGMVRCPDLLDPRQRVALGMPARRAARGQVDRYARIGAVIVGSVIVTHPAIEHVSARAALQSVVTRATFQGVVAVVAVEVVVPVVAGEMVSVVRPVDVLDAGERVALGVPAEPGAHGQVDGDARVGPPVVG